MADPKSGKTNPLVEQYKKQNKEASELQFFYDELSKTYEGRKLLDKVGLTESPSTQRKTVGKQLLQSAVEGLVSSPDAFFNPAVGAADMVSALTGGGGATKDAEAAITKYGRRNLTTVHSSDAWGILNALRNGGALDLMSFGVTKRAPVEGFGDTTLVLNPQKLDPEFNPNSKLWNRDTYTPTRGQELNDHNTVRYGHYRDNPRRLLMGQDAEPRFAQALAIKASPTFSSFKQYEKSSAGAATLDKPSYDDIDELLLSLDAKSPMHKVGYNNFHYDVNKLFGQIVERAGKGDSDALKLLKTLKQQKSNYAEGKLLEPFEINADNVVGAIFRPHGGMGGQLTDEANEAASLLRSLGIEAGAPHELLSAASAGRRQKVSELKAKQLVEKAKSDPGFEYETALDLVRNKQVDTMKLDLTEDLLKKRDAKALGIVMTNASLNSSNAMEEIMQQMLSPDRLF